MDLSMSSVFAAGLLTFFTPCVLPVVPMYFAALAGGGVESGKRIDMTLLFRSLFFSGGFVLVFVLMGAAVTGLSSVMGVFRPVLQLLGGVLVLLFALKFLGIIRIPLLDRIVKADDRGIAKRTGLSSSFLLGVVFAAGWSPCVGPILASVLTYTAAETTDMTTGVIYLTLYGAGFALPFVLAGAFAGQGIALLRRFNRFLPVFEHVTGIVMLGVAVYMFSGVIDLPTAQGGTEQRTASIFMQREYDEYPLLVEFYAADCPVCNEMEPVVERLFEQCQGRRVELMQIDITRPGNRHFREQYAVNGVPTFILFDSERREVARMVGKQTAGELYAAIAELRGERCENAPDGEFDPFGKDGSSCGS